MEQQRLAKRFKRGPVLDHERQTSSAGLDLNARRFSVRWFWGGVPFALVLLGFLSTAAASRGQNEDKAKDVFDSNCQMCHGDDGTGTDAGKSLGVPDLSSDDVQKLSDDMLFDVVFNGKNNMPAFRGQLSADEIHAAISHVRTFAKKK